ncbi:MAG TPA: hypothetical protein VGN94_07910 [Methylobacterium sp.]|nr:hypothetical protein [Methylobacterium sp.]
MAFSFINPSQPRVVELMKAIAAVSPMGLHCAFGALDAGAQDRLRAKIAEVRTAYAPLVNKAQALAQRIGSLMEPELAAVRITATDLFDTDYRPIAGTNPQQYRTSSVAPLEALLPDISRAGTRPRQRHVVLHRHRPERLPARPQPACVAAAAPGRPDLEQRVLPKPAHLR